MARIYTRAFLVLVVALTYRYFFNQDDTLATVIHGPPVKPGLVDRIVQFCQNLPLEVDPYYCGDLECLQTQTCEPPSEDRPLVNHVENMHAYGLVDYTPAPNVNINALTHAAKVLAATSLRSATDLTSSYALTAVRQSYYFLEDGSVAGQSKRRNWLLSHRKWVEHVQCMEKEKEKQRRLAYIASRATVLDCWTSALRNKFSAPKAGPTHTTAPREWDKVPESVVLDFIEHDDHRLSVKVRQYTRVYPALDHLACQYHLEAPRRAARITQDKWQTYVKPPLDFLVSITAFSSMWVLIIGLVIFVYNCTIEPLAKCPVTPREREQLRRRKARHGDF